MGFWKGDATYLFRSGQSTSIRGKTKLYVHHFTNNGWWTPHGIKHPEVEEHVPIPRSEESIGPIRDVFANVSNHGSEPRSLEGSYDFSFGVGTFDINTLAHRERQEI